MNHIKGIPEMERREARSGWTDVRTLDPVQARRVFRECKELLDARRRAAALESAENTADAVSP